MRKHWKIALVAIVAALIPFWVFGDPPVYFAKEIHGQVIDAVSRQPLSGVVVVAKWQVYATGIGSGGYGGSINTIEVVTDGDGKYLIPGWGPRLRPPLTYLDSRSPELRYFKSNYFPVGVEGTLHSYENRDTSMVRTSEWDGKAIQLKPFKGDDWPNYARELDSIWSPAADCLRDCPRLILALDAESKRIKALAPNEPFIPKIINIDGFSKADREFLKRYKNEK